MSNLKNTDYQDRADLRNQAKLAGLPIRPDSAVEVSRDEHGKPQIESVKPVYRPPELMSKPVKRRWAYIWAVVIIAVIVAWICLYWYFSIHQAPYAAPIH